MSLECSEKAVQHQTISDSGTACSLNNCRNTNEYDPLADASPVHSSLSSSELLGKLPFLCIWVHCKADSNP